LKTDTGKDGIGTCTVPGANLNNKEHKVKIVGDSHLRGTATEIDQYLNTKFKVCSWIKPGAKTELVDHWKRILSV
jgi:small nuclear ribonucleoprotein (snRNP)-like protein